jgi:hypothetical protein
MRIRFLGHVARLRKMRNARRILVGKLEMNEPLWRPRYTWEDNVKSIINTNT